MSAKTPLPPSARPGENPYAPGAGYQPPALTGRESQIRAVRILLERVGAGRPGRSLLIVGLRGVGKTVLLNTFEQIAEQAGWETTFHEIAGDPGEAEGFRDVMADAGHQLILKLDRRRHLGEAAVTALRTAWGVLRPTFKVSESGQPEMTIGGDPGAFAPTSLSRNLTDAFLELGVVAQQHKTGAMILLDEVQNLDKGDLSALIMALHRVSQKALPVVVIAAGLPNLPALASEVETYAERLFKVERIGQLDRSAALAAIVDPSKGLGVTYSDAALEAILVATDRWPYFLQEWGQKTWDSADSIRIDTDDTTRARPLVLDELDEGFFRSRYDRASERDRDYLYAMASLGAGPYVPADVWAAVRGGSAQSWAMYRARLIAKGLIYSPRRNEIDFTVPHFGAFLLREQARNETR